MKNWLFILCACLGLMISATGCAEPVYYGPPETYTTGPVEFCDDFGCRTVFAPYHYVGSDLVYWDYHFNCWIGPRGYWVGGVYRPGFVYGYRNWYVPGYYHSRGAWNGGFRGGYYHGGGGHFGGGASSMKKFVDMYGYEKDYYCPYCKDQGFFRDDLSGGESYCTCEAGQNLKAEDSYLAMEASLVGPEPLAEEADDLGDQQAREELEKLQVILDHMD